MNEKPKNENRTCQKKACDEKSSRNLITEIHSIVLSFEQHSWKTFIHGVKSQEINEFYSLSRFMALLLWLVIHTNM